MKIKESFVGRVRKASRSIEESKVSEFHGKDNLLRGITYEELIDAVHSNEPTKDKASVMKVYKEIFEANRRDAEAELKSNMTKILKELK